jgi:hypothetical protein
MHTPPGGGQGGLAMETSVESIGDTPIVETLQPHRLPVPRRTGRLRGVETTVETAVMIQG